MTVRSFLIDQGLIQPHDIESGQGQFRITCPHCKNDKRKCYVDARSEKGVFCFHCKFKRTWRGFQRLYEPPTPEEVALETFLKTTEARLQSDPRLMQYFADRGLTEDTVKALRFGYCDTQQLPEPTDADVRIGLAVIGKNQRPYWFLGGRITIPYIRDGYVHTFRGRTHPDDTQTPQEFKYVTLPGDKAYPYYPSEIDHEQPVIAQEGEFDAAILRQNGIQAIGFAGANSFEPRWFDGINHLYVCMDGDKAGREGTENFVKRVSEVRRVDLPDTYDTSEYINNFGIDSYRALLERSVFYLYGRPQKEDRFAALVDEFHDWSWANGSLLGPSMGAWAPRLEEMLCGWQPGLILIGAEAHCFSVGTKVMMHDGSSKNVEDVTVGDKLMGPDSQPRTVTSTCAGVKPLHKVRSLDGSMNYTVTGNHILALREYSHGHKDYFMTVDSFYEQTDWKKSRAMMYRAPGVDFPEQAVNIPPYILGLWLGDGTSCRGDITTADYEIECSIRTFAAACGYEVRKEKMQRGQASTYAITGGFTADLKTYNLLNNKHIPTEYLRNSERVRKSLLAGIIDSDGYFANECSYEIVQKNKRLAEDIVWLARSLGIHATLREVKKVCTNAKNGRTEGTYYSIHISGDLSSFPIQLERKEYKPKEAHRYNPLNRSITVEPAGVGAFAGFEVDGDHLFLGEDFTVLHNSGKSCFMVKALYELCLANSQDTIGVYLSLDDTMEETMKRLVSLHTRIDFNDISKPRHTIAKDPQLLEEYQDAIKDLKGLPNIVLRDATYGRSLRYLSNYFESLRTKYPDKRLVVFVDSLAKITGDSEGSTEGGTDGKTNWKAHVASELKYLTTKYKICLITPTDLRKLNGVRRPTKDDLKDAAELYYEAQVVLFMYNDLKRLRDQAVLFWHPHDDTTKPKESILEVIPDKNKFTGRTDRVIRYRMLGSISEFWELDEAEDKAWDDVVLEQLSKDKKP